MYRIQIYQRPAEFFTVTNQTGIFLWRDNSTSGAYDRTKMIDQNNNREHKRGEMNAEGLYIVAGFRDNNVKLYDMKYQSRQELKIKLLSTFEHTDHVYECIFRDKDKTIALCCDRAGFIKEYNLANPSSINPTTFNKTELDGLHSILLTNDEKYVIAGSYNILYILQADDASKVVSHRYKGGGSNASVYQMAEVWPGILVTVDYKTASIHDIRDITTIPKSMELSLNVATYYTVISLKSSTGDLAIGGASEGSPYLGFVYILHMDSTSPYAISTLKNMNNIQGDYCVITAIKELSLGTILIGGEKYCQLCLWNYSLLSAPICWDNSLVNVYDLVRAAY